MSPWTTSHSGVHRGQKCADHIREEGPHHHWPHHPESNCSDREDTLHSYRSGLRSQAEAAGRGTHDGGRVRIFFFFLCFGEGTCFERQPP